MVLSFGARSNEEFIRLCILALAIVVSMPSSGIAASPTASGDPFAGVDLSSLAPQERQTISEAVRDFQDVVAGKLPTFAKVDGDMPLPADGGTTFYVGRGYRLTIVRSLSSFGKLDGFVYGPVITFDPAFAPGNVGQIASTRFYTPEQMGALLGG